MKKLGKEYPWPRPSVCPECNYGNLWRHGFVPRYFEEDRLFVIKYRCNTCESVHTMRSERYYRRFTVFWFTIFLCLFVRISAGKWSKIPGITRERQRYWLKGLLLQGSRTSNISISDKSSCLKVIEEFLRTTILSTHSTTYFEITPFYDPLHLSFSLTPGSGFG